MIQAFRQSATQAARLSMKAKPTGKNGAKKTPDARGVMRLSGGEADWWNGLYRLEKLGLIEIVEDTPKWELRVGGKHLCNVKGDAAVREIKAPGLGLAVCTPGVVRFLDYKGWHGDTPLSRHKRKHLLLALGVELECVGEYVDRQNAAKAKAKADRDLIKRARNRPKS